ncbi:hypothetical protein [Actinomadura sp. HBU206391]|uniref:hypothetical protein n=1 Tax=Actinomadura sp. HBU206391 TaxID=2731692 RepID=UPI00164F1E47|nr:hypothetical protein [Actinomadura sp. HBU206391]MBC6458136.1 hypothetical protein [Actinomadura sp. HBU206391]
MSKITYIRGPAVAAVAAAVATGGVQLPAGTASHAGIPQAAATIVTDDPNPPPHTGSSDTHGQHTGEPRPDPYTDYRDTTVIWPGNPNLETRPRYDRYKLDRPKRFLDRFQKGGYKPRKRVYPNDPYTRSSGIHG